MVSTSYLIRPSLRCLQCAYRPGSLIPSTARHISATASQRDEASLQNILTPPPAPDPLLVSIPSKEPKPRRPKTQLVGSRRWRAASRAIDSVPFEQLPYQCFQEARKILAADREEKLQQIQVQRRRIKRWLATDPAECGGQDGMKGKLVAMQKHLEHLKILADSNDPTIKMRFEDGKGDMNRPIYRFFADREWRSQRRQLLLQRITQMHIVPDIIPHFDPVAEVNLAFGRRNIQPGEFVDSLVSETAPRLRIQVFDQGKRLISIVVVDPDIPNEEKDSFDYRCHYLALNIPVSPTITSVPLLQLGPQYTALPWLPPTAQKGAPYHRLAVFVLQHLDNKPLDLDAIRTKTQPERFNLRSFCDKHGLKPVGAHLFRNKWDEGTARVMVRANLPGAEIEWHRKKPEKLPYEKKDSARYRGGRRG